MKSARSLLLGALCVFCGALSQACGGGQTRIVDSVLSTEWQDDHGRSIEALRPAIEAMPIAENAPVVVGVVAEGLVGRALDGGAVWTFQHAIDSRPAVSADVVAATGGGELFLLEARTGRKLWSKPAGGLLRGIGDDGRTTALSLTQNGHSSIVLAVEHNGTVVRQVEAAQVVGVPAIRGTYVFLPWTGQYVSVINLATGEEAARILFRERVSRAIVADKGLYFGEQVLLAFDANISRAYLDKATYIAPPERALPGDPAWFRSGFTPAPAAADARDKVALSALPRAGGAIDGDRFVATYFDFVFGMSAKTGATSWIHTHHAEILSSASFEGGTAICDAEGKVTLLDNATGGEISEISVGRPLLACVAQVDGLKPSRAAKPTKPLVLQLAQALDPNRAELVAIQKVFVGEAAALDDARATKTLVDLVCDPRTSPDLVQTAGAALTKRKTGSEFLVAALDRHYDYLKDVTRTPPIGVLADGLAAMQEKRAGAPLAAHLLDPATSLGDVRKTAEALAVLASSEQLADLRSFFALYRTYAVESELVRAVVSVARAILRVGGPDDRELIANAAEDAFTTDGVRAGLHEILSGAHKDAAPSGAPDAGVKSR